MTHTVPTVHLDDLFGRLDFLALALPGQKPCFKGEYYIDKQSLYSPTTWLGPIWRSIDGEKQDVTGNVEITKICTNAAQTYASYKDEDNFGPMLLDKIINARQGLARIAQTYDSIGKRVTASAIRNSGIFILDNIIPHERKILEGIVLPPVVVKLKPPKGLTVPVEINAIDKVSNVI